MSRAFIDDDSDHIEELPELPQSDNPGYITPAGMARLNEELRVLEQEKLPPLQEKIEEGAADVSQAEGELAAIEQRVKYLHARIARAIVVDPSAAEAAPDRVHFGSVVIVRDQSDHEMRVHIVGEDETDPEHNRVSCFSPLAKALMTRQTGETVTWHRPIGDLELTILRIEVAAE